MLTGALTPVSNRADWIEAYGLTDIDTDEPVDLAEATEIEVEIRRPRCQTADLTATLSGEEIEHIETGVFQWSFTADQMEHLSAGTYDVFIRITKDEIVTQLLIGTLPVVDG